MPLQPPDDFLPAAEALGVQFDPGDLERLGAFLEFMLEENKSHNLTAITDPAEAWRKHVLDAMTLVPLIAGVATEGPGDHPLTVADVGSGGGVPAIPLAIVLPDVRFTLIEATGKKVEFLRRAADHLNLPNVSVLAERAERVGQMHAGKGRQDSKGPGEGVFRERFDIAMARALGHLAIVAELCGPLVRPGGFVLAVKGAKADQELEESRKAMGLLGLRHSQTVQTPTGRVVILEKTTRTPRDYPRRDGEPKRRPLGLAAPGER